MEQLKLRNSKQDIRIVEIDKNYYVVANEVAKLLGYKNARAAIKTNCRKTNYRMASVKTGKQNIDMYVMNSRGVEDLIKNTTLEVEEKRIIFLEFILIPCLEILNGNLEILKEKLNYIDTIKAVNECLENRHIDLWERHEKLDKKYQDSRERIKDIELENLHLDSQLRELRKSKEKRCPMCSFMDSMRSLGSSFTK